MKPLGIGCIPSPSGTLLIEKRLVRSYAMDECDETIYSLLF